VFVADRAGSPPPASRSGEPSQIITEVATLIRTLAVAWGTVVAAVWSHDMQRGR
jgi:leucyl aminopeptidase